MPSDPSTSVPKPPETSTSVELPTTTILPSDEPISDEQFAEVLTALSDATSDQITEIVTTILDSELSTEQATQLVASPEILSAVTSQQAQQLFEQVEETQLSEAMACRDR
jgi:formate dehydrogenase maturation protein FdhE